ncbi:unnamed protein product, partial [Ectocarpus sp. 12 AP-2014]
IGERFILRHQQAKRLIPFWLHRYLYQFCFGCLVWIWGWGVGGDEVIAVWCDFDLALEAIIVLWNGGGTLKSLLVFVR